MLYGHSLTCVTSGFRCRVKEICALLRFCAPYIGNLMFFLTVHHSIDFFQITNLMHNSFILQQYVCYTKILNIFRAARCSSSGGKIVSPQPLVSSPSVNSRTVCRWRDVPSLPLSLSKRGPAMSRGTSLERRDGK